MRDLRKLIHVAFERKVRQYEMTSQAAESDESSDDEIVSSRQSYI